ncbi:hypothetical protein PAXINDRAFT_102337 [Paxillus involutus ATCC 200175]|uniref:Uncharacterized protein n=1 Tax=Paxillus involutus ATCC 200175 TaxID=664439 RepID=A0A0C9SPN0_PAXIN|nr:hypothetical protein PAXINDRAFT_102337 [Paxillus involutus ATCC 200175]
MLKIDGPLFQVSDSLTARRVAQPRRQASSARYIWTDDIRDTRRAIQEKIDSTNVPALHGTRLLDIALFDETTTRLPLEVPPDIVGDSQYLRWQYPGLDIQHDGDALYRRDMDYFDAESSSASDVHLTSDPTYEYESVPSSPIWSSDESDDDENESQSD